MLEIALLFNMNEKKFSELSIKDKVAYVTALASFFLGWGLIIAGFIVNPLGEISASVITAFGTALVYTASVLGISLYFSNELMLFKKEIKQKINKE